MTDSKTPAPLANYVPTKQVGSLVYISGQLSMAEGKVTTGLLGKDLNTTEGQAAAKQSATNILNQFTNSGRPLTDIKSIVKITVLVAATPDFTEHHLVANGASDYLIGALGEPGRHTRAAFGVSSLPLGAAVEIDAIIEV